MKPRTAEEWLQLIATEWPAVLPEEGENREAQLGRALERLYLALRRERTAWEVLLGKQGLNATIRGVRRALTGTVQWPEPEAEVSDGRLAPTPLG